MNESFRANNYLFVTRKKDCPLNLMRASENFSLECQKRIFHN